MFALVDKRGGEAKYKARRGEGKAQTQLTEEKVQLYSAEIGM